MVVVIILSFAALHVLSLSAMFTEPAFGTSVWLHTAVLPVDSVDLILAALSSPRLLSTHLSSCYS